MFNSYLPHHAPCLGFFIGQRTFSRNVCHVQASSNGNNGLRQHCDMVQQWQLFISCIIHSISLGSLFFSLLQVFFKLTHTLFLGCSIFFPITHDPISIVTNVNYFLVAHEFFLSFSPSCFSNHVIDSYLTVQNLFPSHCMTLFPQSNWFSLTKSLALSHFHVPLWLCS